MSYLTVFSKQYIRCRYRRRYRVDIVDIDNYIRLGHPSTAAQISAAISGEAYTAYTRGVFRNRENLNIGVYPV